MNKSSQKPAPGSSVKPVITMSKTWWTLAATIYRLTNERTRCTTRNISDYSGIGLSTTHNALDGMIDRGQVDIDTVKTTHGSAKIFWLTDECYRHLEAFHRDVRNEADAEKYYTRIFKRSGYLSRAAA